MSSERLPCRLWPERRSWLWLVSRPWLWRHWLRIFSRHFSYSGSYELLGTARIGKDALLRQGVRLGCADKLARRARLDMALRRGPLAGMPPRATAHLPMGAEAPRASDPDMGAGA